MRTITFVTLALLLAACSSAGIHDPAVQSTPSQISITPLSSPTQGQPPTSLIQALPTLKQMGYSLSQVEDIWELFDNNGQVVLSAPDDETIAVQNENGTVLTMTAEDLKLISTIGAGLENVLTIKNAEGEVQYFYLEKAGYWVTPIESQRIELGLRLDQCPSIDIQQDLKTGRMVISEALLAEQFPTGTHVPRGFFYNLTRGIGYDFNVMLQDSVDDEWASTASFQLRDIITQDNDYRRWVNCYRSVIPAEQSGASEDAEVIIATEQILMPDGLTSLFFHYVFGHEWGWEEREKRGSFYVSLLESLLTAKLDPNNQELQSSENVSFLEVRPVIHIEYGGFNGGIFGGGGNPGETRGAEELYQIEGNEPTSANPELLMLIYEKEPGLEINGNIGFIDWAGPEVADLQYLGLVAGISRTIYPDSYFGNP